MRISEIDILIIPGSNDVGPDHWQSRWHRNLKTAARIAPPEGFQRSTIDAWTGRIVAAAGGNSKRRAVIVAHGAGVAAVTLAAPRLWGTRIAGAFLVAPADIGSDPAAGEDREARVRLPMAPLPFPAKLIGSSTDPDWPLERVQEMGAAWGADVSIIANAGRIDEASGHGPWPEGLLTFGLFLKRLG